MLVVHKLDKVPPNVTLGILFCVAVDSKQVNRWDSHCDQCYGSNEDSGGVTWEYKSGLWGEASLRRWHVSCDLKDDNELARQELEEKDFLQRKHQVP